MEFTEEQLKVTSHNSGNVAVIAGAGSGKTRCLVERTANLIANGEDESTILLFTFTKKAAKEIHQRIAKRLGKEEEELTVHVSTIHSLALRIFRDHSEDMGFEHPTLWSPERRGRLINEYYKECLATDTRFDGGPFQTSKAVHYLNCIRDPNTDIRKEEKSFKRIIKDALDMFPPVPSKITDNWPEYYFNSILEKTDDDLLATICAMLLKSKNVCGVIEFDDMQPGAVHVLNTLSSDWKTKFTHIMVDEYQDVNDTNVQFLRSLLHEGTKSLMVVGDDDQSIYGFRGSNTEHILHFPEQFDGEVLYLTKNFRSSPEIINLANTVIKNNEHRYDKKMVPNKTDKGSIDSIYPYMTNDKTITYNYSRRDLYLSIFEYIQGYIYFVGLKPSDIAILARNNLNLTMASHGFSKLNIQANINQKRRELGWIPQQSSDFLAPIPFQMNNVLSILKRKHIKIIFNVLSVLINPSDYISIREMLMSVIPGFGSRSAEYFMQEVKNNREGMITNWLEGVLNYPRHGKKTKIGKKILDFSSTFSEIQILTDKESIVSIWHIVLNKIFRISSLEEKFKTELKDVKVKYSEFDDIRKVTSWLKDFAIDNYELQDTTAKEGLSTLIDGLHTEIEAFDNSDEEVQMMTIHASKGKEWPVVFLLDLDDDTLPGKIQEDIEEERRLFYVGATRAESCLIFCRAMTNSGVKLEPSMFWLESGIETGNLEY